MTLNFEKKGKREREQSVLEASNTLDCMFKKECSLAVKGTAFDFHRLPATSVSFSCPTASFD